ncbi:MAG: MOSC domain-containing protein [Gammaproteobacteria bacterium]|nr:MOSC domain-containing protein [Gammaproteobacteria bacterium]
MTPTLAELFDSLPQRGRVTWLGSRPARRAPLAACATLVLDAAGGIVGDHYAGRSGRRQVTLVQHEHLAVIAALLADARPRSPAATVDPALLRRNVVVAGINLAALAKRRFRIGAVLLEGTGACHPCSRMEETFGAGGYNAVRGHGGITARIVEGGIVACGDAVVLAP